MIFKWLSKRAEPADVANALDPFEQELRRRGINPSSVTAYACTGCGIPGWLPITEVVHAAECPVVGAVEFLSLRLHDGSYSHPSQHDLRRLKKPVRRSESPVVISHPY